MKALLLVDYSLLAGVALLATGCGSPSTANIALRKQLQQRDDQIAQLQRQHAADQADLAARRGPTTTSLSSRRLATLYTTHGIKLGRLTDADSNALKVQVVPTDGDGQPLKAAGTFDVAAFDLSGDGKKLGDWTFDAGAARSDWLGQAFMYAYVLPCPWQTPPTHDGVTIRVRFTDSLTGRQFTDQRQVRVRPAPTTASAILPSATAAPTTSATPATAPSATATPVTASSAAGAATQP